MIAPVTSSAPPTASTAASSTMGARRLKQRMLTAMSAR